MWSASDTITIIDTCFEEQITHNGTTRNYMYIAATWVMWSRNLGFFDSND